MTHDGGTGGTSFGGGQHDPCLYAEIQISRRLSSGEDVQEVLADIPSLLVGSLGCCCAVVLEISPDLGRAGILSSAGLPGNGSHGDDASPEGVVGGLAPDASLAGYVAALQRRACAIEDLDEAPFSSPPGLRAAGVRSAVAAKVEVYGEPRYVVASLYQEPISRRNSDVAGAVDLMSQVSSRLTDALEKDELAEIAAFGDARQEFFFHLTGELDTAQRPEEVLRAGADACVSQLPGLPGGSAADLCVVDLVVDSDGNPSGAGSSRTQVRRFYASSASEISDRTRHSVETVPRLSSRAGPGKVIYSGERELVEHVGPNYLRKLARDDEDLERLEQIGALSYMAVPLRSGRETIGCVGLLSATVGRRYHPGLWRPVGEFVALSISKFYAVKALEEQSRVDPISSDAPNILGRYWPAGGVAGGVAGGAVGGADGRAAIAETRATEPPGAGPLTGRQYEVLNLIDEGVSATGIARRLHLTEGTVQNHCTGLYRSLGAHSKVEALAKARQLGLLSR